MKIDRFIISTDENPKYIYYWPIVAQFIKKLFDCKISLAFITDKNKDNKLVKRMGEFGEVILFKTIRGIPTGNQAKVSRMYLASSYSREICILNDVDMLLLNSSFLNKVLEPIANDKLVAIGANAYIGSDEDGKFPMYYTTALGETFHSIINPANLDYVNLLNTWKKIYRFDKKESIGNPPENFSDESLLRVLLSDWKDKHKIVHVHRNFKGMKAVERIDRSNWNYDIDKVKSGWYIDSHLPRPINQNYDKIKGLLSFFNVNNYKLDLEI